MLLRRDLGDVAAEQAFLAANSLVAAAGTGFSYLLPASAVALGLAMLRSAKWSPWVGRTGLVVGGAILALALAGVRLSFFSLGNADLVAVWYAVVGLSCLRPSRAPAAH